MTAIDKYGRGLLLVGGVALLSKLVADNILPTIGSVTLAIMIGMLVGNLPFCGSQFKPGFTFAEKRLLPVAIVFRAIRIAKCCWQHFRNGARTASIVCEESAIG